MADKKKKDVLQKPVHVAILRPSHIQKLAKDGKLPDRQLAIPTPPVPTVEEQLPKMTQEPAYRKVARQAAKSREETILRTKLRVIHENVPAIPADKQPPCASCNTSPCCTAFMVNISVEEYNSGLYGDYAVKLTHQDTQNLGSGRFTQLATMRMPSVHGLKEGESQYFLEGPIGTSCPMLQEDGRCGIYEKRPITCRTYTCVGDDRITQDMRDGKVNIEETIMNWMLERAKNS